MLKNIIGSAIGREKADTVFKNAGVFDVFGGKIEYADVAVKDGVIAGIGAYDRAEEVVDCAGKFLMPGFIDAHAHIESTHLTPCEFAKAVVPRGTTAVIADPHEIANVRGLAGIRYLYEESAKLPLQVKIMFPSCVPASPFDSSGAVLTAEDMERALAGGLFSGVGEFMNYPGVLACDGEVLRKLEAAKRFAMPVDGHAPGLTGRELSAYVSAGIYTEHECATVAEMEEKLSRGMYILMRQGSSTRNLLELLRGVTPRNMRRCLFCTDDKTPGELLSDGHIDNSVRMAIRFGLSPVDAVTIASLNAAECYGLRGKGAIAPGYDADILITGDAGVSAIERVYIKGVLAAENGRALFSAAPKPPASVLNTVNIKPFTAEAFRLPLKGTRAKVIRLVENNVLTESAVREVPVRSGLFDAAGSGFCKIAVVERHKGTGRIGLGILEGFGVENGAIAVSVAHDSHNVITAGDNDGDMYLSVKEIERLDGGLAVVSAGRVVKSVPLEVAGLMTAGGAAEFSRDFAEIARAAHALGVPEAVEPFMLLSFMSLSVIPHLKVTERGLFDADKFAFTDINAED